MKTLRGISLAALIPHLLVLTFFVIFAQATYAALVVDNYVDTAAAGQPVFLTGSGFSGVNKITVVDGINGRHDSRPFVVQSDNSLSFTTAAAFPGNFYLIVSNNLGEVVVAPTTNFSEVTTNVTGSGSSRYLVKAGGVFQLNGAGSTTVFVENGGVATVGGGGGSLTFFIKNGGTLNGGAGVGGNIGFQEPNAIASGFTPVNAITYKQLTILDTIAPVVAAHSNVTVEATSATGATVIYAAATATDAVGVTSITYSQNSGTVFPIGATTVTITARDPANNAGTGTFTVTVVDTTAPVVAAHGNVTVAATSAAGATVTYAAGSATDIVTSNPTITYSKNSGTLFPIGVTTVTITARDAANNAGTGTFTVTVTNNAPVVTLVGANPLTFEAAATYTDPGATATDVEDGARTPTITSNTVVANVPGTYAVTWSATDALSATGSATRVVNVVDTTAPVVAAHANVTVAATSAAGATVTYAAGSATDVVTASPTITYSKNTGTVFQLGITMVTITARDAANNAGTGTFTVTVQDMTAPVITVTPGLQTVNTGNSATAALPNVTTLVTATDNVGVVSKTQSPAAGTQEAPGTYDVVVTAADAVGLTAQTTVQVQVVDNAAPVVAAHANVIVEATSAGGATATYAAGNASDNVGVTSLTYSQNSGTAFPVGVTTVMITAKDAANNQGTGTFTVTVRDTTAPVVAVHANVIAEATSAAGAAVAYAAGSAMDAVTASPAIAYSQNSGTVFPLGLTTVTISATDEANNVGTRTFTVTVQDTTKPALTLPANIVAEATGANGVVVSFAVSASDTVSGALTPNVNPPSGSTFALGITTANVSVTDGAGNTQAGSFTVAVQDTTNPVVAAHANVTVEATGANGATVNYAAGMASDVVGVTSLTYSQNSETVFPIGVTTVTISAKDAVNNTGTGTFTVTVLDATAPSVAAHANVTAEATSAAGAVVNYSAASASDAVGVSSLTYSQNSGTIFPVRVTTVTITAKDAENNMGTGTFTVTVQDTIAPVITSSTGVQTINTSGVGTTAALPNVTALVTATDSVGVVSKTQSPAAGTLVVAGSYDIVVTVSDAAGHSTQSTVSVTVNDPVVFTAHPASTFVHEGSSVSFTVAITGTEPQSYQWEHKNQPIINETGATLTISDAKAADGGSYRCAVTNVVGSQASDVATLEVRLRPRITVNPKSQEVRPKGAVTFKVEVSGYGPMTYQWRKDGVDLPGETGAELSLSNATTAVTGRYTVTVTNEVMSVESEQAELRLIAWAEVDGTYQGLLLHDNSASPAEPHYLGRLTVTLSKLGAMTGKLEYHGLTHSFSGKLTPELNYHRTILRKNQGPLNLSMHLDASAFTLSAHLSEFIQSGQFHSDSTMSLHGFNASKNPAPQAGRYTMRIKQGTTSTGGPDAPGYALTSISKSGVVTMTGKMSDGSALSCSTLLNEDGSAAFYDPLYKAAYPYAGYIAGPITFDPAAGLQAVTGNLEWKKPVQTKDVFWPLGFSQTRELEGSLYIPPIRGQRILNLTGVSGAMTFTASGPASFTNNFLLTTANRLVLLDFPNTRKLVLKLVPATGITTGSFYDSTLRKTRQLQGVALQAQGEISGFVLSDTDASEWTLSPP